MAPPLADVDRDIQAFVAVVFDILDCLPAHGDRLAEALGNIGFARRGAQAAGVVEDFLSQGGEPLPTKTELLI